MPISDEQECSRVVHPIRTKCPFATRSTISQVHRSRPSATQYNT